MTPRSAMIRQFWEHFSAIEKKVSSRAIMVATRCSWKSNTCSSLSSPKEMPPDMRTVAVSGTLNTFHPRLSKKVARCAWPVVLPPQGPPVSTSLWILRVGGRGSFTSKSFIFFLFFSFLDVFSKFSMSFVKFVKPFSVFKERSLFLSVFNYTLQDYDTRRKRWGRGAKRSCRAEVAEVGAEVIS